MCSPPELKHDADYLPGESPPHFNFTFCKEEGHQFRNLELRKIGCEQPRAVNPTEHAEELLQQLLVGINEQKDPYGVVARLRQSSTVRPP